MKFFVTVTMTLVFMAGTCIAQDVISEPDIDGDAAAVHGDAAARQTLEQECIAQVVADSPYPEFYRAVRILAIIGSDACVDPLTALLSNPDKAHLVRNVLENMESEKAGAALRSALETTAGAQRLGVISSLMARKDAHAVGALSKLLADSDVETVAYAANALGQIATPESIEALYPLLDSSDAKMQLAGAEGLLCAARQIKGDNAAAIYKKLIGEAMPDFIEAGAFTGLLAAQPGKALDQVIETIRGEDELLRLTAIAALATLDDDAVAEKLGLLLPSLDGRLQALVISALAERHEPTVLPLLHTVLGSESEEARLAAMQAIAVHGNVSSIEPLCSIIEKTDNRPERMAAVETLRRLHGDDVDSVLIQRMQKTTVDMRGDLMEVLAQRNAVSAVDAIIEQSQYDSLRPAAFRALTHLVATDRLDDMLHLLGDLKDDVGRPEAESAVVALCQRIAQQQGQIKINKAVYGDLPDGSSKDVADVLTRIIESGVLAIDVGNGNFGDPAPGVVKNLHVEYTINGVPETKVIAENQKLILQADALPQGLTDTLAARLDGAASPAEQVSLLRVLSRLGGSSAYQLVLSHLEDDDSVIRDGAIRALSNWPDTMAAQKLTEIFAEVTETAHRMVTLRGCVRLLRLGQLEPAATLALYSRLVAVAQNADERKLLLAGLADLNSPDAIPLVMALLEDESVQTEADMALQRIGDATGMSEADLQAAKEAGAQKTSSADDGFIPLFDGKTLDGWAGEPALWRVEDGCIIGESTKENPVKVNTFLTWEGDKPGDFELTFRYKLESDKVNSGVQIRSERFEGYRVRGYQADIANEDWISGICYEEGGRGILARRGQKLELGPGDEKKVTKFADENELGAKINMDDWNEYKIVAQGNHFVSSINGHVMHEIIDNSALARSSGVIAFQLHVGPPMKIRFTDIMLKRLPQE